MINIASISGMVINRGSRRTELRDLKAAVIHLTKAAAADWAPHGITVNAICPGASRTEPNQPLQRLDPTIIAKSLAQIPAGKFGEPEDLGPARRLPLQRRRPLHDGCGDRDRRRLYGLVGRERPWTERLLRAILST